MPFETYINRILTKGVYIYGNDKKSIAFLIWSSYIYYPVAIALFFCTWRSVSTAIKFISNKKKQRFSRKTTKNCAKMLKLMSRTFFQIQFYYVNYHAWLLRKYFLFHMHNFAQISIKCKSKNIKNEF